VSLAGRWSFVDCGGVGHVSGQLERTSSADERDLRGTCGTGGRGLSHTRKSWLASLFSISPQPAQHRSVHPLTSRVLFYFYFYFLEDHVQRSSALTRPDVGPPVGRPVTEQDPRSQLVSVHSTLLLLQFYIPFFHLFLLPTFSSRPANDKPLRSLRLRQLLFSRHCPIEVTHIILSQGCSCRVNHSNLRNFRRPGKPLPDELHSFPIDPSASPFRSTLP